MKHDEDILQAKCFQWAWNEHPETRRCLFHVANERNTGIPKWIYKLLIDRFPKVLQYLKDNNRSFIGGNKFKAMGVVPGIPDMLFVWKLKLYPFELKTGKGTVSPEQRKVHEAWKLQGVDVPIIRTFDDFKREFLKIISS